MGCSPEQATVPDVAPRMCVGWGGACGVRRVHVSTRGGQGFLRGLGWEQKAVKGGILNTGRVLKDIFFLVCQHPALELSEYQAVASP